MTAFAHYASAPAHKLLCDQRNDYFVQSAATRNGVVAPFHAGQAQQAANPPPTAACPASITQSAGETRQREFGPLSEGEQYAADACEDGRAYVFDGRGFLVD